MNKIITNTEGTDIKPKSVVLIDRNGLALGGENLRFDRCDFMYSRAYECHAHWFSPKALDCIILATTNYEIINLVRSASVVCSSSSPTKISNACTDLCCSAHSRRVHCELKPPGSTCLVPGTLVPCNGLLF